MDVTSYTNYRKLLKDELERRISSNSSYSLRAFARNLGIAPQILSQVLKGTKGISVDVAVKQAYLMIHEIMHTFIPLTTKFRNKRVKSMVLGIEQLEAGQLDAEDFPLQIQMNGLTVPTSTVDIRSTKVLAIPRILKSWSSDSIPRLVSALRIELSSKRSFVCALERHFFSFIQLLWNHLSHMSPHF